MKIVYMICKTLCIADLRNVRDNLMKHYRWIWVDINLLFGKRGKVNQRYNNLDLDLILKNMSKRQ
jgi:hypothetical protein